MLDRGCARALADLREQFLALRPVLAEYPDLDQFVCLEATLDLADDTVGKAGARDDHDGTECVSASPKGATLGGTDLFHTTHCR